MALLTPPPAAPQRGDRTTFANRVDAFITWLINFVSELVALVSSLNSIAAGGVYAIPYTFGVDYGSTPGLTSGMAQGGILAMESSKASQSATAYIFLDIKSIDGRSVVAALDQFDDSTSLVRGQFRIEKAGDPSKWMLFNVIGSNASGTYHRAVPVALVDSSSASPFGAGDPLLLYFQRTGDKGDAGATGSGAMVLLSQQTASSAVANIDFTSVFTSAYDKYIIDLSAVKASATDTLCMRVIKSGTPDSASGAYLTPIADGATGSTANTMSLTTASGSAGSFVIDVLNANDASVSIKAVSIRGSWQATSSASIYRNGGYVLAGPLNGFRLYWNSGSNFTQGTVRVYGIKNS
jgi:hypothetical protein